MENGTSFLEKLDEQSIFWSNVLDPGNQRLEKMVMALAESCSPRNVSGMADATFDSNMLLNTDWDTMLKAR